jgi:hypothetical protein
MKEEELSEMHITHAQMRKVCKMFVGKLQGKTQLGLHVCILKYNIQIHQNESGCLGAE